MDPGYLATVRIGRQKRESLDDGLSDEHPVERVFVNRRQTRQRRGMGAGHREFDITVVEKTAAQHTGSRCENRRGRDLS